MNSGDFRVTALLTEHLGFAPLTLVDEVINAVNQIMYNCTDALETFLKKRRGLQLEKLKDKAGIDLKSLLDGDPSAEKENNIFPLDEIRHGTAELETLLVSHVDKNFDKFELYTLRNILTLPKDLVEEGWIRLKHHENLDLSRLPAEHPELNDKIKKLVENIDLELQLRKVIKLQLSRATKILDLLKRHKLAIESVIAVNSHSELTPEIITILKEKLTPLNENIYYLFGQLSDLMHQIIKLNDKFLGSGSESSLKKFSFASTQRDAYLNDKSMKILEMIGVLRQSSSTQYPEVLYSAYAQTQTEEN